MNIKELKEQYGISQAFINQSDKLLSQKCEFVQSQIHLDTQEVLNQLSENRRINQRVTKEIKQYFSNLHQLQDFNFNGCIIKSISNMDIVCQMIGSEGSLLQDCVLEFVMHITNEYPYKPPEVKMISDIKSLPFINNERMIVINILSNDWSPALSIRQVILSIIAVLNANLSDQTLFCEANTEEIQEKLKIEKESLKKFKKVFREYVFNFYNSDVFFEKNTKLKDYLFQLKL